MILRKTVRIFILIIVIIGILPLYIALLPDGKPGRRVKEITAETYKELQKTDEMYGDLPYGARVSEIYVNQQLGDAFVYVHVTVPEENIDSFAAWLTRADKQFSNEYNLFYFSYFVGDSYTHFGAYEESNGMSVFGKIYWTVGTVIIICLLIPYEVLFPLPFSDSKRTDDMIE